MKALRHNKVIGLAIGERSLLAAEVIAGEPPMVKRLAEFVYPEGVTFHQSAELGKALGGFLREQKFSAKTAIVGLPARWLVVKPKEVPPAEPAELADMLRLQAEGDFSSELKDLVYDFAGESAKVSSTVLLVATPRKYIELSKSLCESANLHAGMITSSAVALGAATRRAMTKTSLVLAVSSSGAELTSQSGESPNAIRHLRAPGSDRPFIGELRRAVSTTPSNGTARELVLWDDCDLDADSLATELGFKVRNGDLPGLGVNVVEASSNGEGRRFAAAVALGLMGINRGKPAVDFLHSRLAPPRQRLVPPWVLATAAALVLLIGGIGYFYSYIQNQQVELQRLNDQYNGEQGAITSAAAFVKKVSFAQAWHGGNPRYLSCLRDLTNAIPEDEQTYATSLIVRENVKQSNSGASSAAKKTNEVPTLSGLLYGKTSDQAHVQAIIDRMKRMPGVFTDVELVGSDAGRGREDAFSISFTYLPPKNVR